MAYTNSKLVDYTRISPNHSSGRDRIDTITIHCVVGQCTVEALGARFAQSSVQASSNYGIGYDGRVGMYVEEKDRSWCSSNTANDKRAVTIEVASDTTEPYAVRQAAYDKLILLVADICQRNGIKGLKWSTDKSERMNHLNGCNMTVHRDYANKSCPGTWLYERMGQIAAAVNAVLDGGEPVGPDEPATPGEETTYTVTLPLLVNGSEGAAVKAVQRCCYSYGFTGADKKPIAVDGIFGENTEHAVRALQAKLGLDVDGEVGGDTWTAMLTKLW